MIWVEIAFALLVAIVLAAVFVPLLGWRRPGTRPTTKEEGWGSAFLFLFLLLFLATWAGGAWLSPYGPTVWGVPWLGFLLFGVFVALLIAAVVPPSQAAEEQPTEEPETGTWAALGLGLFFWILLSLLVFAIVGAYAWRA